MTVGEMSVTNTSGKKLHLKINTSTGMENVNTARHGTARDCEKNKLLKFPFLWQEWAGGPVGRTKLQCGP
jgi:hypothetical protein